VGWVFLLARIQEFFRNSGHPGTNYAKTERDQSRDGRCVWPDRSNRWIDPADQDHGAGGSGADQSRPPGDHRPRNRRNEVGGGWLQRPIPTTEANEIGQKCDKDELTAIRTNKPFVKKEKEKDEFDVTLPIHDSTGKIIATAGMDFKLQPGRTKVSVVSEGAEDRGGIGEEVRL
jgi:hypothetical protein